MCLKVARKLHVPSFGGLCGEDLIYPFVWGMYEVLRFREPLMLRGEPGFGSFPGVRVVFVIPSSRILILSKPLAG